MIGEISIGGVFIPSIIVWGIIAFILLFFIRRIMVHYGLYRWVWHQALFDISLFAILLSCITFLANKITF